MDLWIIQFRSITMFTTNLEQYIFNIIRFFKNLLSDVIARIRMQQIFSIFDVRKISNMCNFHRKFSKNRFLLDFYDSQIVILNVYVKCIPLDQ